MRKSRGGSSIFWKWELDKNTNQRTLVRLSSAYFLGRSWGMPSHPQKILKIWVLLLYMHSAAIWNLKYQDSILNKIIGCGYNDAWFVTLCSKVTTALEQTKEEYLLTPVSWKLINFGHTISEKLCFS